MVGAALGVANTEKWIWWDWIDRNTELIWEATREHIILVALSVGLGLLISLPLGVAAARRPRLRTVVFAVTGTIYTIPSLAFIAVMVPYVGLARSAVVVPLTCYTLLILVRNIVAGLDAVPADVKDSADGMGYRSFARLVRVELPLALPAIMAGLRIAVVTTIGLATIAAILGLGGLGQLMLTGLRRPMRTAVTVGAVLSVGLAVVVDLSLALVQRRLTPWVAREQP
jgi:osmoprotectant transport system permease protein